MTKLWSIDDWLDGQCEQSQVGKPKPIAGEDIAPTALAITLEVNGNVAEPSEPDRLSYRDLDQAALRVARDHHGSYDAFLKANPDFHKKYLLTRAKAPDPVPAKTTLYVDIPWLSKERLSYPGGVNDPARLAASNEAVQDVEPKAIEDKPIEPWKPGDPTPKH